MSYITEVLADTPVAFWRLNETTGTSIADSSGSSMTGTLTGVVTIGAASIVPGDAAGKSMVVDREDGQVGFLSPVDNRFAFGTGDFAFEFSFKTAFGGTQVAAATSDSPWFGLAGAEGSVAINGSDGADSSNDNVPHHAIILRRSGQIRIYVDGALSYGPVADATDYGTDPKQLSVGHFGIAPNFTFTGSLSHVAVYRHNISDARIAVHYAAWQGGAALTFVRNLDDVDAASATSATVRAKTAFSGAGAVAYAWYKSTDPAFTPGSGNVVAGQTGQTATFTGLAPGVDYWVRCVATDGVTAIPSFARLINISGLPPLRVGQIGDSTNKGGGYVSNGVEMPPAESAANYLRTRNGLRKVSFVNSAVAGTSAAQWVAGSSNMLAAEAAFTAAGMTAGDPVIVRIGVNDAQAGASASAFGASLDNIIGRLTSLGFQVQLDYPTWREPGVFSENTGITFGEETTATLFAYYPVIDAKVNGTTVFAGDKQMARLTASKPSFLNATTENPGAIHETVQGAVVYGINSAEALLKNLGLIGGGSTGGINGSAILGIL